MTIGPNGKSFQDVADAKARSKLADVPLGAAVGIYQPGDDCEYARHADYQADGAAVRDPDDLSHNASFSLGRMYDPRDSRKRRSGPSRRLAARAPINRPSRPLVFR